VVGPTSYRENVWVEFMKKFKKNHRHELFPIISVKYLPISDDPKDLLQLVSNKFCPLPWQSTLVDQRSSMILESQDPMHEHTKWVPFPQLTKINEMKLKSPLLVQRHN
jgi:hypothetical protein